MNDLLTDLHNTIINNSNNTSFKQVLVHSPANFPYVRERGFLVGLGQEVNVQVDATGNQFMPNLQFTSQSSDTVSHRGQPYLAGKSSYILMGLKFVTFSTTTSLSIGLRLMWTRKHTVKDREFVIFLSCYVTDNHILFSVIDGLSSFLKNKQQLYASVTWWSL